MSCKLRDKSANAAHIRASFDAIMAQLIHHKNAYMPEENADGMRLPHECKPFLVVYIIYRPPTGGVPVDIRPQQALDRLLLRLPAYMKS